VNLEEGCQGLTTGSCHDPVTTPLARDPDGLSVCPIVRVAASCEGGGRTSRHAVGARLPEPSSIPPAFSGDPPYAKRDETLRTSLRRAPVVSTHKVIATAVAQCLLQGASRGARFGETG
jgi:hypothetical protein